MASTVDDAANDWLTPSKENQVLAILKGECPHNAGWTFVCSGHNDGMYRCNLCGKEDFY